MIVRPGRLMSRGSGGATYTNLVAGESLHSSFTTTNANGTRRNAAGLIEAVPANTPRFDYDVNGNLLGLLVEEERTNLALNSEHDEAATAAGTSPPTVDGTAVQDGINCVSVTFGAGGGEFADGSCTFSTSANMGTSQAYSGGFSAKLSRALVSGESVQFYVQNISPDMNIGIDSASPANSLEWTDISLDTVEALTVTSTNGDIACFINGALLTPLTVYVTHRQLEAGSFRTSYIPTADSAVTRNKDANSRTYALPSAYSALYRFRTGKGAGVIAQYDNGTTDERVTLERNSSDEIHLIVVDGGVTVCDLTLGTVADDTEAVAAFALSANDAAGTLDGGTVQTDATVTIPNTTTHRLAQGISGDALNGHIEVGREWEQRLPNDQLQSMTA